MLSVVDIVPIYWGAVPADEIATMEAWLQGFAKFLNDSPAAQVSKPATVNGQEQVLRQYGVYGAYVQPKVVQPAAAAPVGLVGIVALLNGLLAAKSFPKPTVNRLYVIFAKGITWDDSWPGLYGVDMCAFHDQLGGKGTEFGGKITPLYFAFLPYPTHPNCGSGNPIANWQSQASHEIMEAATDPYPGQGWGEENKEGGDEEGVANVYDTLSFGSVQHFADNQRFADTKTVPAATFTERLRPHLTAVASGPGRLEAYARIDSYLQRKTLDHGSWASPSVWSLVAGSPQIADAPSAVSWGPGRVDLFARRYVDNALMHGSFEGATSGWQSLGGTLFGPPVAVSSGPHRLDVFVLGGDSAIWQRKYDGGWKAWERVGGEAVGPPAVVSWGPNRLDVFIRATDARVYHKAWDENGWQPEGPDTWESLGGQVIDVPVATSWAPGRLDIIVKGTGRDLFHKSWEGDWQQDDWEPLGGSIVGTPAVVAPRAQSLHIFARGDDRAMWHRWWDGDWSAWTPVGGVLVGGPVAVANGPDLIEVICEGTSGHAYHRSLRAGTWSPPLPQWTQLNDDRRLA